MGGSLNQSYTCDGNDYKPTWKDIVKAIIIGCVSIGIIVGNLFSVIVFNSNNSRKVFLKKVRLTMNSLICTDLSIGLLMCPFCIYPALYKCWPYSETVCKIEALLLSALFHESTLSLVLIALDRYFSVHHYLRYNSIMTSRKYVMVILFTWFATFAVYAYVILIGDQFYYDIIGINCEPYYANRNVTLTVICIFYIVPMLLFLFSYGSIFAAANRKRMIRTFTARTDSEANEQNNNAVSQILKTSKFLAAITVGFVVSVTPWTLCTVVMAVTNIKLNEDVDFAVTWLAISNSFWNVVIYSVLNRKFRYAVTSLFRGRNGRSIKDSFTTMFGRARSTRQATISASKRHADRYVQHDISSCSSRVGGMYPGLSNSTVSLELSSMEQLPTAQAGVTTTTAVKRAIPDDHTQGSAFP